MAKPAGEKKRDSRRDSILKDEEWKGVLRWIHDAEENPAGFVKSITDNVQDFAKFWKQLAAEHDEIIEESNNIVEKNGQLANDLAEANDELQQTRRDLDGANDEILTRTVDAEALRDAKLTIRYLEKRLEESVIARAVTPAMSTMTQQKRKALPDPAKFDQPVNHQAGNASKYRVWKQELLRKIQTDLRNESDEDCLNYALTRVGDDTALALSALMSDPNRTPKVTTVEQMLELLDNRYISPNALKNAKISYRACMQYGKPFEDFLAQFCMLAADARISEEEQMDDFKARLNHTLRGYCVSVRPKESFTVFVDEIREIAWDADQLEKQKAKTAKGRAQAASGSKDESSPVSTSTDKPKTYVKTDTRQCYACKKFGHIATDCPEKKTGDKQPESPKELPSTKSQ